VFQHLAEQIVHAVHALDQRWALQAGEIDLVNMQRQLTEALSAMVKPMVSAMEMRDPYTAGHESRVADIAVAIGTEMGLSEERLHGLYVAAQVHDIGKISIPAEILTKPTKLTDGEWSLIREQPGDRLRYSERHTVCLAGCRDRAPASRKAGWLGLSQGPEGG